MWPYPSGIVCPGIVLIIPLPYFLRRITEDVGFRTYEGRRNT